MKRIYDITTNDLRQLLRDRQTFLFLLLMPIVFTLLFGFAFGSFNKPDREQDTRLSVTLINQDQDIMGNTLSAQLEKSTVMRISEQPYQNEKALNDLVKTEETAAVLIIPEGYSKSVMAGEPLPLSMLTKQNTSAGYTVEAETIHIANRLNQSVQTTNLILKSLPGLEFDTVFLTVTNAWNTPPVRLSNLVTTDQQENPNGMSTAQTAPGMMLQFSLAGLLTAGQMIVNERKSRVFQRLLTTAARPLEILFGHYFAILTLIFVQFILLVTFGQIVMGLDYISQPLSTLILIVACAVCIAAIGLLIGMLAKTDDQAIIFAMIPMFIFSGLGGAWMPLESTGKTFQTIGHFSPVAWGMDGFKAILTSNGGLESIWLPVVVLFGYGLFFFALAAYALKKKQA